MPTRRPHSWKKKAREMSTVCSLSQCSKAAGPIQQKSAGRFSSSSPASEKQPSGMTRFGSCGSYLVISKPSVRKVRHFSKARVCRRACGASWLSALSGSPTRASAWHSSNTQHPKSLHSGAVTVWSTQHRRKAPSFRHTSELGRCTMSNRLQCCQAASPMVCTPASTCKCLTSFECVKAWGSTCPERVGGTWMALAFLFICPLCSAREQH